MAQSFRVDRVSEATEPPALDDATSVLRDFTEGEVLATSGLPAHVLSSEGPKSALVRAIGEAYDHHRALVLTPDAVWLTLAHGLAAHVLANAEQFRDRLVRHEGVETLRVDVDAPIGELDPDAWAVVIARFEDAIVEHTGPGIARFFAADFSTSTAIDRTVSRVLLMSALSRYFDFSMDCICGIPRVRLEGSVDDWCRLRDRVALFHEWDLSTWQEALLPICDELVRTAEGKPSLEFWRHVYKSEEAYGSDVVTGWLSQLFLFREGSVGPLEPNEVVGTRAGRTWVYQPMHLADFPATVGAVTVRAMEGAVEHRLRVHAGLAFATYDPASREVGTASAWWVERRGLDTLFARLGPTRTVAMEPPDVMSASATLVELVHRFGGQAILDGAFVVATGSFVPRQPMQAGPVPVIVADGWFELATLPDGRVLCFRDVREHLAPGQFGHREEYTLVASDAVPGADARIIARSTLDLLERLVEDPRYFDRDA
jgi:hypothetical protein